eukprot:gene6802-8439_t
MNNSSNNNTEILKGFDTTSHKIFYKREKRIILTGQNDIDQYIRNNQHLASSISQVGGVIELYGSSGSGKSNTALQILINAILPLKWGIHHFGGNEIGVIYFDNDFKLDILNLRSLLHQRFFQVVHQKVSIQPLQHQQQKNNNNNEYLEEQFELLFRDCLSRLYIYRCMDSFQFLVTLKSVGQYIRNISNKTDNVSNIYKPPNEIYMIIIDSISAFYWIDQKGNPLSTKHTNSWVEPLKKIINEFSMLVIATKQTIFNPFSSSSSFNTSNNFSYNTSLNQQQNLQHREFLGNDWGKLVKYRKIIGFRS